MVSGKHSKYFAVLALLLVVIVAAGAWSLRQFVSPAQKIDHIILISIDTCRADYLSCYGYSRKTTPNIDAVATEGILFENTISPVPLTLPAHSSMLTGTIPPYHGVHHNTDYQLAKSNLTLAEILGDNGFKTSAIISAVVLDSKFGIAQGFDTYNDRFEEDRAGVSGSEREGGEATRFALEWLEKQKDEKSFLFLHYFDPHYDYVPPEPFASRFADDPYAGEVAYTDHCIGQVLSKLKELGLYDSSLIIITADHGEMLDEHGENTHGYFIYQSAIRVPLIVKLPGRNKTARIKTIAGLIDIVPTVCSLLGIETPENVQGVDLFSSSNGDDISGRKRHIYCESLTPTKYNANSLLGVVNYRYKYIQTARPELYDLIQDPAESNNLIKKQQQQAEIMKVKLSQILEQSQREASQESQMEVDARTMEKIRSLGYVEGSVSEDFSIDQTKDDPKDVLQYHRLNAKSGFHLAAKEYHKAEMDAKQMIKLRPDCIVAYARLGTIAHVQKDYPKALVYFQKALELEPDNPNIYHERGSIYLSLADYDQAIRDLDKSIQLNPEVGEPYNHRGLVYLRKGDYHRATADFDKAIELDPGNAQAYSNRGTAYVNKGDYDRAFSDFDKAIDLDPKDARTYNNRALAYLPKGELDRAISDLDKAIELDRSYAKAYNYRGLAFLRKGDYHRAIPDFDKAIELDPSYVKAYSNRGIAYSHKGDYDQAISDFDKAIELDRNCVKAYNYRGAAYGRKGEYGRAIRDLNQAIELDPNDAGAYNNRAVVYVNKGDDDRAIRDFEKVIELDPSNSMAQKNIGSVLLRLGKTEEALSHYREALRLRADWPEVMNVLAWILATHKDAQIRNEAEALRFAERACKLTDYKTPEILDTLGAAYAGVDQFENAFQTARQAIQLALAARDKKLAEDIRARLELYKSKRPWREPFRSKALDKPELKQ